MKFFSYIVFFILFTLLLMTGSCKSSKQNNKVKPKPDWVLNRPVNGDFYVGIGTASKSANHLNYQQIAKKNAFDDMISEIQVTVSSSSVLKTVQNNLDFKQQFNSTTKVTVTNTVENYDVIDSWENGEEFWVYFRLSKAEYEAAKRRKMQVQINRAEDLLILSDRLDLKNNFVQVVHLKIQALTALQNYLNEDVIGNYRDKEVKLVDMIFNSIQDQLYNVKLNSNVTSLKGKVGKPLNTFEIKAFEEEGSLVSNLPLKAGSDDASFTAYDRIETDNRGIATFTNAHVQGVGSTQFLRIAIDMQKLILNDSMNAILKTVLMSIQSPPLSIKVAAEPLKIIVQSEELNLSKQMDQTFFEPIIKKEIIQNGCELVINKNDADYIVRITTNTQSQGVMWKDMQGASILVSISIIDTKTGIEIYKGGLQNIKGFQTTAENAGIDAYKKGVIEFYKKGLPNLINALFSGGN